MSNARFNPSAGQVLELVTMQLGDQLFAIAVQHVHDILGPQRITRVPLAPKAVAGSLNLRGRIVTVLDLRVPLGLCQAANTDGAMNVVVDMDGELYALLVDQVGEVLTVPAETIEPLPKTLSPSWRTLSHGIVRLENQLLLLLIPERALSAATDSVHIRAAA